MIIIGVVLLNAGTGVGVGTGVGGVGVGVAGVGVAVGVGVGVAGVGVRVGVGVAVGDGVGVGVAGTGVAVGVGVIGVGVGVAGVAVGVGVAGVGVAVGVGVAGVAVGDGVAVGVAVADGVGVGVPPPAHGAKGLDEVRGIGGSATLKSFALLSVSVQLLTRTMPCAEVNAVPSAGAPPSALVVAEAPYAAISIILESSTGQRFPVAPQPSAVVVLVKAIFPLDADALILVVVVSAVKVEPAVPVEPNLTK